MVVQLIHMVVHMVFETAAGKDFPLHKGQRKGMFSSVDRTEHFDVSLVGGRKLGEY